MSAGQVSWSLLGGPDAVVDEVPIEISTSRSRAVLILLVTRAGQRVQVSRIIDELWPDAAPKSARNSVQRFVSDLRRCLGAATDRIESVTDGYRLRLEPSDSIDAVELEAAARLARRLAADGQQGDALAALARFPVSEGEPIPGLNNERFIVVERQRLHDVLTGAGELELECLLALGKDDQAIRVAMALIERSPYRDAAWVGLITSQYRRGRGREALDSLHRYRVVLRDELGLDLSPSLCALEHRILNHDPELARPPVLADIVPPEETRSAAIIGRSEEIDAIVGLLAEHRAVTITGTGGIGKTSVATEVARHVRALGRTVHFVGLADTSASGFMGRLGEVVGSSLRADRDTMLEITDRLHAESALIVFDNCEHLIAEVVAAVGVIEQHTENVTVLCTSRLPLARRGEALAPLGPLSNDDSVLLLERHIRLLGVTIEESDRTDVENVTLRLDGIPLAIELAASAVPNIGLRALTDLADPGGRLALVDRRVGTPDRHRSMGAVLDWSLDRIDDRALELLALCASFDGEFDLSALVAVGKVEAADLVELLGRLTEYSLIQALKVESRMRYRVLVPIREHVRHLGLPGDSDRDQRFLAHYVDVVESGLSLIKGHDPMRGIELIRTDLANIRTAFDTAAELGDTDAMSRLATALGFATAQTASTNASATLRGWASQLAALVDGDASASEQLRAALSEAYRGSGDWSRFARIDPTALPADEHSQVFALVAANLTGDSAAAFEILSRLDVAAIADPLLRTMACGHGTMIALANGSDDVASLVGIAAETARHSHSPSIVYYAEMASTLVSFFQGDVAALETSSGRVTEALEGHGLVTLENLARLAKATFLGLGLGVIDPVPIFADMVGEFVEQNSLDPGAAIITLNSVTHILFDAGYTSDAARLAGLVERLGLAFSPLDLRRGELTGAIDADPVLSAARRDGRIATTTDVLWSTHQALREMVADAETQR